MPADDQLEEALKTFTLRDHDTDGLSLYEVSTEADRRTVLAAIACVRDNADKPLDWLEIPRETIEKYGAVVSSAGTTPVARANALHRSLDWAQHDLDRLARELYSEALAAKRYSAAQVRSALVALDEADVDEAARALLAAVRARLKLQP